MLPIEAEIISANIVQNVIGRNLSPSLRYRLRQEIAVALLNAYHRDRLPETTTLGPTPPPSGPDPAENPSPPS